MALSRLRRVDRKHVLVGGRRRRVLANRNVLQVVVVLLFTAEGQLGAFVELVCVALARNAHHDKVFAAIVELPLYKLLRSRRFVRLHATWQHGTKVVLGLLADCLAPHRHASHWLARVLADFRALVDAHLLVQRWLRRGVLACHRRCNAPEPRPLRVRLSLDFRRQRKVTLLSSFFTHHRGPQADWLVSVAWVLVHLRVNVLSARSRRLHRRSYSYLRRRLRRRAIVHPVEGNQVVGVDLASLCSGVELSLDVAEVGFLVVGDVTDVFVKFGELRREDRGGE